MAFPSVPGQAGEMSGLMITLSLLGERLGEEGEHELVIKDSPFSHMAAGLLPCHLQLLPFLLMGAAVTLVVPTSQ